MKSQWQPLIKPAFLQDLTRLSAKDVHQIMEKVTLLTQDPRPDSKVKKHLTHCPGKPHRIRSGDYRIFYTFNQHNVYIYKIDRRDETTYKECPETENMLDADILADLEIPDADVATTTSPQPDWERSYILPTKNRPLPEPITVSLLTKLHIPPAYHASLLQIKDEDALLTCTAVNQDVLLQLLDYLFERPLLQVMQQPDLVLNDVDDLLRYKNGDLLTFLLKLSPEQEKYVTWPLQANGPTLVKGGPGTGKSTVALYRIRSLQQQLQQQGKSTPHVLFTTYTNALIKSSEQLLQQLLGDDARYVRVQTADKIVYDILQELDQVKEILTADELKPLLRRAVSETPLEGNLLQQEAQRQTFKKMGYDYLLQEIQSLLIARQITDLPAYLALSRSGRKLSLTASQRTLVWRVYERLQILLQATGKETWQQRRARAESLVEQTPFYKNYNAVVIDEAQDLDPSALRLLVKLCISLDRLFVTADANQSIYGSGFAWSDVHQSLKFQGRTSILRANYRSTRQIGEAAQSYLNYGTLEPESIEPQYINNGPLPSILAVQNQTHEAQLLATFFRKTLRSLSLTLGSCAVLCPSGRAAQEIANALKAQGLAATSMTGRTLNLSYPGIKVLTLSASKGLEFPIVALAGFISSSYPFIPSEASTEEADEILARERRTLFVGMTRAMRALLVIVPATTSTSLLQDFETACWNLNPTL